MIDRLLHETLKELLQQGTHRCVEALLAMELDHLALAGLLVEHRPFPLFLDVVHGERDALVFVPRKGDGANPTLVVLEVKAFDVDGQGAVHVQQLDQPRFDVLGSLWVLGKVYDARTRCLIVAPEGTAQGVHGHIDLALNLDRVVEQRLVAGHVEDLEVPHFRLGQIAQMGFDTPGLGQGFEVLGIGHGDEFGVAFLEVRHHLFFQIATHLGHRGFLLARGLMQVHHHDVFLGQAKGFEVVLQQFLLLDPGNQEGHRVLCLVGKGEVVHCESSSKPSGRPSTRRSCRGSSGTGRTAVRHA
ncbi:hypothetical protein D3C85_469200 [compost metagenome]